MSIIKNPKYLPVFHHIAKNAGTYALSWMMMLCRKYYILNGSRSVKGWTSDRIRRSIVTLPNNRQLTCCIYTKTDIHKSSVDFVHRPQGDGNSDWVKFNAFIKLIKSQDVEVFSVSVDPLHWGGAYVVKPNDYIDVNHDDTIKYINEIAVANHRQHLLEFTVLRDPYARSRSLYNYIKSDNSAHEPNHDSIVSDDFYEYLTSYELEDSWIIRTVLSLRDDVIIEPRHFTACCKYLDHWRIADISNVDLLIDKVFHGSYGILQRDVEPEVVDVWKNSTPHKVKIRFQDLRRDVQEQFLDRTYWDRALWNKYCGNVK